MGTNVYAVLKDPRKLPNWDKIEIAVSNRDPWTLIDEARKLEDDLESNKVHLGKRSGGWKFTFDFQDWKYFDHTVESINKFLKSCWCIMDEYGEPYSIEKFWEEFALWNPTGLDGEMYEKLHGTPESYERAKINNWYMSSESPAGKIPRDLPYVFSNHTDFS